MTTKFENSKSSNLRVLIILPLVLLLLCAFASRFNNKIINQPNVIMAQIDLKNGIITCIAKDSAEPCDKTFTKVETESTYPGGQSGWREYLVKNLRYPDEAVRKKIQGDVIIQFIVDKEGGVREVEAISGPMELRMESIRIVQSSGKWEPAVQNGYKVCSYKKQPIRYRM